MNTVTTKRFQVYPLGWKPSGYRYEIFDKLLRYPILTDLCFNDAVEQTDKLNREYDEAQANV